MVDGCGDCCVSTPERSSPQHQISSSLPFVGGMNSISSPVVATTRNAPVNPYEILQIRRDATPVEIRQSFKRLALFNHPGRETIAAEGRMRRLQSFNLLAACYETIMDPDSRRRYDAICREQERSKLQAGVRGALFVGGKPLQSTSVDDQSLGSERKILNGVFSLIRKGTSRNEKESSSHTVPPLSRASSESSSTEQEEAEDLPVLSSDHEDTWCAFSQEPSTFTSPSRKISRSVTAATVTTKASVAPPSLVDATTSEDDDEAEAHFTEKTTRRLFGGPLSNLFKARNFEPFSDPYDVFEDVFGSQPFTRVSRKDISCADDSMSLIDGIESSPASPPRSPSAWRGEKHTSSDGTKTVYTTSRIVHDRRLTRTETVTRTPNGITKTHVSVTAEPITPTQPNSNSRSPSPNCLICFGGTTTHHHHDDSNEQQQSSKNGGSGGVCDDACSFWENIAQQLDFTREEFLEEWRRMLSYDMSFNLTGV